MNYLPVKLAKLRKHYNFSQNYIANVLGISVVDYMVMLKSQEKSLVI